MPVPLSVLLDHIKERETADETQSGLTLYLAQKDIRELLPWLALDPSKLPLVVSFLRFGHKLKECTSSDASFACTTLHQRKTVTMNSRKVLLSTRNLAIFMSCNFKNFLSSVLHPNFTKKLIALDRASMREYTSRVSGLALKEPEPHYIVTPTTTCYAR